MATHKQTYKHTHASSNAVTLVWGSLRLAPITMNTRHIAACECRFFQYILHSYSQALTAWSWCIYKLSFTLVLSKIQNKETDKQMKNGKTTKLYICPHKTLVIASHLLLFDAILNNSMTNTEKRVSLFRSTIYIPTVYTLLICKKVQNCGLGHKYNRKLATQGDLSHNPVQ